MILSTRRALRKKKNSRQPRLSLSSSFAVEFVIQIQKKAAGLASEAEAHRREAWAGTDRFLLGLGFHLYKYLCKPQEIKKNQVVSLLRSKKTPENSEIVAGRRPWFFPFTLKGFSMLNLCPLCD